MAEKQIDAMASIERILEHIQLPLEEEYYVCDSCVDIIIDRS